MELSFGSEYNKEEFEKKIKEINEYDGSLLERSPYAGWEEINVKKVALDGQKKKREKSIQNRRTWAIGYKHLRGRHDQRDHNRWPAGYQAQTYVPTGRRAGAMAARATGGLVGTTQMNILANRTTPDILADINQQNIELNRTLQEIQSKKATFIGGIQSFQFGLLTSVRQNFETSTILSLLDARPDYDIELLFDHLVEEMAEKAPRLLSGENRDSLTYGMRTVIERSKSQQELEDAIINLMQDTQDKIAEVRQLFEEGVPRYRLENASARAMNGLSNLHFLLQNIDEQIVDEMPEFGKLLADYANVKRYSMSTNTIDNTDGLKTEVTTASDIIQSMIDSGVMSEKEEYFLRNVIDNMQSFLDTSIEKQEALDSEIAELDKKVVDIETNIAQLRNEMSNVFRALGQVTPDDIYADNKEVYDAELFSTDAKELSEQSGRLMYQIANGDDDVREFAEDLQLDVDNLADMQLMADLVGIFTEPSDFSSASKNVFMATNPPPDREMTVKLKMRTVSGGFINTERLVTIDDSRRTIDVESISVEQENLRGIGYAMTIRQIAAAMELSRRTGYKVALRLDAVSRLGSKWRGYNVWPKLGYDFMIPSAIADALNDLGFTHNRTSDLMLDKSTAKSSSGKYSQYDGKTPVELWNDLVEEILQDEYQFSEVGAIVFSPDDVETQRQSIDVQVMIEYNKLLRKKLGKTTKSKRNDAYLQVLGFSADEMAMFDEAWGNVKKSTKKPKKNEKSVAVAQQYKHLRGRHDQRDHAWNRGMGRGGSASSGTRRQRFMKRPRPGSSGAAQVDAPWGPMPIRPSQTSFPRRRDAVAAGGSSALSTEQYQLAQQQLRKMVASGDISKGEMRNRLQRMRGLPSISRRQELMTSRATGSIRQDDSSENPISQTDFSVPVFMQDSMYQDNKEVYNTDLFSSDARRLTEESAESVHKEVNQNVELMEFAKELQLDTNNMADMQLLADLLGIHAGSQDDTSSSNKLTLTTKTNYEGNPRLECNSTVTSDTNNSEFDVATVMVITTSQIEIKNEGIYSNNLRGMGHAMKSRQLAAAMELSRRTGKKVVIHAFAVSRKPKTPGARTSVGYQVWPRMGYNFSIPDSVQTVLQDLGFQQDMTAELMLDKSTAKSDSGKHSQYDGKTPIEFWGDLITEILLTEGSFGVDGEIIISPDNVETQQQNIAVQVMIEYNKLLAKKLGKTNKSKKSMKQKYSDEYEQFINSIGFTMEDMEMFDKAWEKIADKKSPAKQGTREKHLRGRHDQRDHAWNRGMGRGATPAGGGAGGLSQMEIYKKTRQSLLGMVRQGQMTRQDVRNQLRELREMPSDSRRQDAMAQLSRTRMGNVTAPQFGRPLGGRITRIGSSSVSPTTGPLTSITLFNVEAYLTEFGKFKDPNMPIASNLAHIANVSMDIKRQRGFTPISVRSDISKMQTPSQSMTFDPTAQNGMLDLDTRGYAVAPSRPNTNALTPDVVTNDIDPNDIQAFKDLDAQFGITTWQFNESQSQALVNEINTNRQRTLAAKAQIAQKVTDYSTIVGDMQTTQTIIGNLKQTWHNLNQKMGIFSPSQQEEVNYFLHEIRDLINYGEQDIYFAKNKLQQIEKDLDALFPSIAEPMHGSVRFSPQMMQFLSQHFGATVNPAIQTDTYTPSIMLTTGKEADVKQYEKQKMQEVVDEANKFIELFIDKRLLPRRMPLKYDSNIENVSSAKYGSNGKGRGFIMLTEALGSAPVYLHELMHAIGDETVARKHGGGIFGFFQNPKTRDQFNSLVNGFFAHRFAKRDTVLQDDDGMTWAPDDFSDWYSGLIMNWDGKNRPVEIVSMGISMLLADPVKFAREEPDYFRFLSVLLSGAWIK